MKLRRLPFVPLQEPRGRRVQKQFDVRVYHRNAYRYTVRANTEEEEMGYVSVGEAKTTGTWPGAAALHRQQRIKALQAKVDELKAVPTTAPAEP